MSADSRPADDDGAVAFGAFVEGLDYPVFVVTTAAGEDRDGCLVGFSTQTSIDPPRLLVCLSKANRTTSLARTAGVLAVHVLDRRGHPLAEHFGGETGDEVDKLAGLDWRPGPEGVPILADCPRRLVGRILARFDLGDHVGHLLAPLAVEADELDDHDAAGTGGAGGAGDARGGGEALSYQDVSDIEAGHPA